MMEDCIFCKIIAGQLPSKKIYEDDQTLAFQNINPEPSGKFGILVVPKTHFRNIFDVPPKVLSQLISVVQKLAIEMKEHGAPAVKIVQNNERPLQEIFHLHFHIIPC
jgi:histidine triad (HIT) family protein